MLWAAPWRSKILSSWGHHLSLALGLRLLWWRLLLLLLGRRQGRVLGLMLVVGHPIGHHTIMLWLLLVLLVVLLRWVTMGLEVLL